MYDLLVQAAELHRLTEGLFDPTILDALESVGYDRSMDEIRSAGCGRNAPPLKATAAAHSRHSICAFGKGRTGAP